MVRNYIKTIFFIFSGVLLYSNCGAQSYGLEFNARPVSIDKRTSLDLSPNKLCFNGNFEISFEFSFLNKVFGLGYILRIIGEDSQNIDLVYIDDQKPSFKLISGSKLTEIAFDIDKHKLFSSWNKLDLKFDFDNNKISLLSGKSTWCAYHLKLKKNTCYKIIFGANNYGQFQTFDVAPMKVRHVDISQNGAIKYEWPLNEDTGKVAHEIISGNNGVVTNPLWITSQHKYWQQIQDFTVNGTAATAFDQKIGDIYITTSDSIYRYSVSSSKLERLSYKNLSSDMNGINQSFYSKIDNTLYNIVGNTNHKDWSYMVEYNLNKHSQDKKPEAIPGTTIWHFNKFLSLSDTSLYFLGGYEHLTFKNSIEQYHLNSHVWQNITSRGNFFMPRYLAALGSSIRGDTAYIIGGYGSPSGQQILGPKSVYDLFQFTPKDRTFRKIFDLKINQPEYVFANSLVINAVSKSYYGLIFSRSYNSELQLITGSLVKPNYSLVGNAIPFSFSDMYSFADLYYSDIDKKFIAITLLTTPDYKHTQIRIFSLLNPPLRLSTYVAVIKNKRPIYILIGLVLISGFSVLIYGWNKLRKRRNDDVNETSLPAENNSLNQQQHIPEIIEISKLTPIQKNAIFLFGNFQVIDADGRDITKLFTPLVRELFLIILLYSIKHDSGISTEKLNEKLWNDKSSKSLSNNRAVNINKLKKLLERINDCYLSKETGYWKIHFNRESLYIDYYNCLYLTKQSDKLNADAIKLLSKKLKRGSLLPNIEYEWLDIYKSEISNTIIQTYLHFIHTSNIEEPEMLIEIADTIFEFDPVNEEAMIIKCKAQVTLGKHSLAKSTFENFLKEYRNLYGEVFKKDFNSIFDN